MYEIFYPPGCYGHYIASSIYYYTNLNSDSTLSNLKDFAFRDGSSHSLRDIDDCPVRSFDDTKSRLIHLIHLPERIESKNPITIQPCNNHDLDYLINVLVKEYNNDYDVHVKTVLGDAIVEKYKRHYNGTLDNVPKWIQREILSYMINDISYNPDDYVKPELPQSLAIKISDIFSNFIGTLDLIINHWGLKKIVSNDVILYKHNEFLETQQYHNIQYKVQKFCESVISNTDANYQFLNLYDEAYMQHLLRENSYELKCHGLDDLPSVSGEFKTLMYKQ